MSIGPQNNRDLNQGLLHLWSKFGDPSLNRSRVIARTRKWLTHRRTDRHTHTKEISEWQIGTRPSAFSYKETNFKMLSAKRKPFCLASHPPQLYFRSVNHINYNNTVSHPNWQSCCHKAGTVQQSITSPWNSCPGTRKCPPPPPHPPQTHTHLVLLHALLELTHWPLGDFNEILDE